MQIIKWTLIQLCACPALLMAQTAINWTDPVMVFDGTAYDNDHPRMALSGTGEPILVWGSTSDDHIYFSAMEDGVFSEPVSLNTDAGAFAFTWAGPEIAASGDTIYVVFKELPESTGNILLRRSFDGGSTWQDPVPVDDIPDQITNFPSVTINDSGHPVVVFMVSNLDYSGARYMTVRSEDHGASFLPAVLSSEYSGGEVCDCCTASIFSKDEQVVTLYRDNLDNIRNMWAAISTDNGYTFPEGIQVDQTNWEVFVCPTSAPDGFIAGDSLYSFWMSNPVGQTLIYSSVSSLTDGTDQPDQTITGYLEGLGVQNHPRADATGFAAALVWRETTTDFHSRVMLRFTQDVREGWEEPEVVFEQNNLGIENADVILDEHAIHVVWQDNINKRLFYRQGIWNEPESVVETDHLYSRLWPVPASDLLHVMIPPETNWSLWEIMDLSGHTWMRASPTDGSQSVIDLSLWPKGLYLFRLTANGFSYSRSFLVQ